MTYLEMIKFYTEKDTADKKRRRLNDRVLKMFTDAQIKKFIGQFIRKYSFIITGNEILFHLDTCMQLWTKHITVSEFEKRTGIALERASFEEQYEIGL